MVLEEQLRAYVWFRSKRQIKKELTETGMGFLNLEANPQQHFSTNKTTPPNPTQTVPSTGDQTFKCASLWGSFPFKQLLSSTSFYKGQSIYQQAGHISYSAHTSWFHRFLLPCNGIFVFLSIGFSWGFLQHFPKCTCKIRESNTDIRIFPSCKHQVFWYYHMNEPKVHRQKYEFVLGQFN